MKREALSFQLLLEFRCLLEIAAVTRGPRSPVIKRQFPSTSDSVVVIVICEFVRFEKFLDVVKSVSNGSVA